MINDGRVFFLKNSFLPQGKRFPLAQVSRVLEESVEHSPLRQHKLHAWDLVGVVADLFEVLLGSFIYRLKMKDLEELSAFVTTTNSVLVKKGVEEGGVYPDVEA